MQHNPKGKIVYFNGYLFSYLCRYMKYKENNAFFYEKEEFVLKNMNRGIEQKRKLM